MKVRHPSTPLGNRHWGWEFSAETPPTAEDSLGTRPAVGDGSVLTITYRREGSGVG